MGAWAIFPPGWFWPWRQPWCCGAAVGPRSARPMLLVKHKLALLACGGKKFHATAMVKCPVGCSLRCDCGVKTTGFAHPGRPRLCPDIEAFALNWPRKRHILNAFRT